MQTVRTLARVVRLQSIPRSRVRPTPRMRYCSCVHDPDTGAILNPTCPGRYDPFETPADAAARGVDNPHDCWVEVPARRATQTSTGRT